MSIAAQSIVRGQGDAPHGRKLIGFDLLGVGRGGRRVLDITLRQGADGTCAEPDEGGSRVCRIALETAVQAAFRRDLGQGVGRQRVMIEADRDIAALEG